MLKKAEKHFPVILLALFCLILICTVTVRHLPDTSASVSLGAVPTGGNADWISNGKLNINEAGADALAMLPGIGPALSQRIVEYRQTHGDFKSTDELLNVKGIGEKVLSAIEEYITIGD